MCVMYIKSMYMKSIIHTFKHLEFVGSPWTPRSPSGKTLLLSSLIFSLVMYNAYAGFITSILSVQATGIKSITDLLFNNFKLGYSAADDTYIRVLSMLFITIIIIYYYYFSYCVLSYEFSLILFCYVST